MFAILGVILLATSCLSIEPSNTTNHDSNRLGIRNLYGLTDMLKKLGVNAKEIKELSKLPNDTSIVEIAKASTVLFFITFV